MIPFLLAAAGGYLIAQSRKDDSSYEDGGITDDEIKEDDLLEADYEKEYINYYEVVKIEKDGKDAIVTFQNANPTQKEITQKLSSLNDEIRDGKYEVFTKVVKNGLSYGYKPKANSIVREGNYLKEVVEKQPVYRVTFFDEGRNEWSLRDVYDESLDRIGAETIKEMIKDGSLQKPMRKVFYKKGGEIKSYKDFKAKIVELAKEESDRDSFAQKVKSEPLKKYIPIYYSDTRRDILNVNDYQYRMYMTKPHQYMKELNSINWESVYDKLKEKM